VRALAVALTAALVCGAVTPTASATGSQAGGASEGCQEGIVHAGGLTSGRVRAGPPCPTTAARAVAPAASTQPRAPSGPPLVSSSTGGELGGAGATEGAAAASAPASGGDPLVENGLGSPLCGEAGELAPASQRNCATSGFEAAGAPTGDYGLDVHIDTGPLSVIPDGEALVQDDVVEPVWMGFVWVVHTVVVALEWCFTLDLLDSSAMGAVERALGRTQASFTRPWLVLALALAGVAAAYNGLVRRRVAETLGQAALTLAMVAGGLWTIADPTGTVGALGRWADAAGAGTLGAVVDGTPAHAPRTLAQSMGGLFAAVVGAPWCYLEFGNVGWCEDPARLEPRLHVSALVIAGIAQGAHCAGSEASPTLCRLLEGESPRALAQSATLLRAARTNGEVFLALPANGPARNSVEASGTLLSVLCGGSEDATDCHGPTAAQAEFRTQSGTGARIAGLVLIAVGEAGVVLLLGFIVMHLLGAEVLSLLYLLLAPVAVVAPALGDGGRAAFRTWGTRLVGAVCSKLVFSFLLGVVLLLTRTLTELEAFGWWTRWLLLTILWWSAYRQRHRTLGFVAGEHRGQSAHQRSLTQLVKRQLEGPRAAWRTAQWARDKLSGGRGLGPSVERRRTLERIGRQRAQATADEQVERMFEREHAVASAHAATAPEHQSELSAKRAQLQRVQGAREQAAAAGDTRRVAMLDVRAQRIKGEVERGQLALNDARRTAGEGERAQRRTGRAYTPEQARERNEWLDAQATLPAAVDARGRADARGPGRLAGDRSQGGAARDYAGLGSLVGYSRAQYEGLAPRPQREARLEIDRELALRRELSGAASAVAGFEPARPPSPGRRERRRAGGDFDRALEERLRQGGHTPPRSRAGGRASRPPQGPSLQGAAPQGPPREGHPHDARRHPRRHDPRGHVAGGEHGGHESSVMRDAHEVARRRKRQLGGG
jgi:hypothetical protein